MRRRIIRQGNNSYTLTLPIVWIREGHLKEGDEVDIKEEENSLVISPAAGAPASGDSFTIDAKNYGRRAILRSLHNAYRKGYDRINMVNAAPESAGFINRAVRETMIGFEVVRQENGSYVIDSIAEPSHEKFDSMQRKIFYIIMSEADKVRSGFLKKSFRELEERKEVKKMIDSYTNLCRRLIVKYKIGGTKNSHLLMVLMSRLVLVHHAYYSIYSFAAARKKLGISESALKLMDETNNALKLLHDSYFSKDAIKTSQLHDMADTLYFKKVPALLLKSKGADNIIIFYLGEIIRLILMEANLLFGLVGGVE